MNERFYPSQLKVFQRKTLEKIIIELQDERDQLWNDNNDMQDSRCTYFARCPKCGHLGDSVLVCQHCDYDGE